MNEKKLARLRGLADAATGDRVTLLSEFSMRVPAEPDRDADLILSWAVGALEQAQLRIANLETANSEARKTIDRLNEMIPREANDAPWPAGDNGNG